MVVDNRPGASGNIGNQFVARAKPDGYTLLVAYSGYQVGNPHLFKKAGWDPIKDFTPVAMLTRAPQVVAARANGLRPVDGPFGNFSDPDAFKAAARRAAVSPRRRPAELRVPSDGRAAGATAG